MNQKTISLTYGFTVCLGALVLVAYALLTIVPSSTDVSRKLQPIEVTVIDTDTTATTDTSIAPLDAALSTSRDPLADLREIRAHASEQADLKASKMSFEDARKRLDAERSKLSEVSIRLRVLQRGVVAAFALIVFAFHWRWLRRISETAA
jgi:hypothetical protein